MINIFIIEDNASYRNSISHLINNEDGFVCTGIFDCCETAQKRISEEKPDVILLDINLPGISGVEGVKVFKSLSPETEIIILTAYDDNNMVFKALTNGASGYILKNDNPKNIIFAIIEVLNGGSPMSMSIARSITESFRKPKSTINLTDQECLILKKLRYGKNYQAIADELFIAKTTVKYHIRKIYNKLHVHNKVNAIQKAQEEGII